MRGLITADWHIRPDKPRCRLDDDWFETQKQTIAEIINLANKNDVPLFIVGDIFDSSVVPVKFVNMVIEELSRIKKKVYFLAGNHDLKHHSIENAQIGSIGTLIALSGGHDSIEHGMDGCGIWSDFGTEETGSDTGIAFVHQLVFCDLKSAPPMDDIITAEILLENYDKSVKWIFTGDNHQAFHYENKGRHVVNPGCILRQSANEIDYTPSVYFVDTDKGIVDRILLTDDVALVTDEYIKKDDERDDRISAFVESIKSANKMTLDIIKNLKIAMENNRKVLGKPIIYMIDELIGEAVDDRKGI